MRQIKKDTRYLLSLFHFPIKSKVQEARFAKSQLKSVRDEHESSNMASLPDAQEIYPDSRHILRENLSLSIACI